MNKFNHRPPSLMGPAHLSVQVLDLSLSGDLSRGNHQRQNQSGFECLQAQIKCRKKLETQS